MEKLYRSPYKFKETILVSHVNIFTSKMSYVQTIFTWLNTMATVSHVLKLDAATIQGWCLLH